MSFRLPHQVPRGWRPPEQQPGAVEAGLAQQAEVAASLQPPNYFEVSGVDELNPALRSAFSWVLAVAAQRHPRYLARMLEYEPETHAVLSAAVQLHCLSRFEASFAESVYGLRRVCRATGAPPTGRQRAASVAALVLLPYLAARYNRLVEERRGGSEARQMGLQPRREEGPAADLREKLERLVLDAHPWVMTACGGVHFAHGLLFLFGWVKESSPVLRLLGLRLARCTAQEAPSVAARHGARRDASVAAAGRRAGPAGARLARLVHGAADAARWGLMGGLVAYKVIEWWYTSAEGQLAELRRQPPPPPPPPLSRAPDGLVPPADPAVCGLCGRARTNPAAVVPSGYVFCFTCIHDYLEQHGRCPVTHVTAEAGSLRRLYQQ